jgi:hypothetical protein
VKDSKGLGGGVEDIEKILKLEIVKIHKAPTKT